MAYEKGLTSDKVGKELNIVRRTDYNWFKKDLKCIEDKQSDQSKRKAGRPAILDVEHQHYLEQEYKAFSSTSLDQAIESLQSWNS